MYDPERAFQEENSLSELDAMLDGVIDRCGENDPWTQRIQLQVDILKRISALEGELDSCFDPDRTKEIEQKISSYIDLAKEVQKEM